MACLFSERNACSSIKKVAQSNCSLYEPTHSFENEIEVMLNALKKGKNPEDNDEYRKVLKEQNEQNNNMRNLRNTEIKEDFEDWDDPNSYANCSDWEDEPESCFQCADDECPMNRS